MPNRSRIDLAREIIQKFERGGLQIIPFEGNDAHIRGQFGPGQHELLRELLPQLSKYWTEVLEVLSGRDANESAFASLQILTSQGNESVAAALGRLGGLKGGVARAKALTKK